MAATVTHFTVTLFSPLLWADFDPLWTRTEGAPVHGHPGPAPWPRAGPRGPTSAHQTRCPRALEGQGWPGREPRVLGGSLGACSTLRLVALRLGQRNCLGGDALGRMLRNGKEETGASLAAKFHLLSTPPPGGRE